MILLYDLLLAAVLIFLGHRFFYATIVPALDRARMAEDGQDQLLLQDCNRLVHDSEKLLVAAREVELFYERQHTLFKEWRACKDSEELRASSVQHAHEIVMRERMSEQRLMGEHVRLQKKLIQEALLLAAEELRVRYQDPELQKNYIARVLHHDDR